MKFHVQKLLKTHKGRHGLRDTVPLAFYLLTHSVKAVKWAMNETDKKNHKVF